MPAAISVPLDSSQSRLSTAPQGSATTVGGQARRVIASPAAAAQTCLGCSGGAICGNCDKDNGRD